MALGTEHVQTTKLGDFLMLFSSDFFAYLQNLGPAGLVRFRVTAEHNVGTTAGHVGRHGDGALTTRLSHNRSLTFVVLRVQHLVAHTDLRQLAREVLGILHAGGTDQNRLALLVALLNVLHDGFELGNLVAVHLIGVIDALHTLVGGNRHDAQLVGVHELGCLGLCGTRHAREPISGVFFDS